MGFFDFVKSMFGIGGCSMEVELDANQVPVGGVLAGRCKVIGADKEYPLTSVNVRLLYVSVQSNEDSAIPDIDTKILVDNVLATNEVIAANGTREYDFTIQIPGGTEPTAHNVSYSVLVTADIPGLKDPQAKTELKVVEPEEGAQATDLASLYSRWPALNGTAERPLMDALRDLRYSHQDWNDDNNFSGAEPVVAKFLRHESADVRSTALETWSHLIGDEATPDNIRTLQGAIKAADEGGSDDDLRVVQEGVEAAARFAKAGGVSILEVYAKHDNPKVRKKVAQSIGWHANDVGKALIVLQSMMNDPEMSVLTDVVSGLSNFTGNGVIFEKMTEMALNPDTPLALRREVANCLSRGWEFYDIVWPGVKHLAGDADPQVRRSISHNLSNFMKRDDAADVVRPLFGDDDVEVRRAIAQQVRWFPSKSMDEWRPVLEEMATGDADRQVQANAVRSLVNGFEPEQVAEHYGSWLAKGPSEESQQTIGHDIMYDKNPVYQPLLEQLKGSEYPSVAEDAQRGLEYEG